LDALFAPSVVLAVSSPDLTSFSTTSTVPEGDPPSAAKIFPDLSITKTPLVILPSDFSKVMALIRVPLGSQSRV